MDRVAHAGKQIVNALAGQAERSSRSAAALARVSEHPGATRSAHGAGLATR